MVQYSWKVLRHFVTPVSNTGLEKYLIKSVCKDHSTFDMDKYHSLDEMVRKKEEEYTVKFTTDKSYGTYTLMVLNVLIFAGILLYMPFSSHVKGWVEDFWRVKNNLKILNGWNIWKFG